MTRGYSLHSSTSSTNSKLYHLNKVWLFGGDVLAYGLAEHAHACIILHACMHQIGCMPSPFRYFDSVAVATGFSSLRGFHGSASLNPWNLPESSTRNLAGCLWLFGSHGLSEANNSPANWKRVCLNNIAGIPGIPTSWHLPCRNRMHGRRQRSGCPWLPCDAPADVTGSGKVDQSFS